MNYKLFIADNVLTYGDSLLYPSGIEIASISCVGESGKTYWVSLQTQGSVCITYKGNTYKDVSQFPSELLDLIDSGEYTKLSSDILNIDMSNWWEFCYSNGDGQVLDCTPKDYNDISEIANDLVLYLNDMIDIGENNDVE